MSNFYKSQYGVISGYCCDCQKAYSQETHTGGRCRRRNREMSTAHYLGGIDSQDLVDMWARGVFPKPPDGYQLPASAFAGMSRKQREKFDSGFELALGIDDGNNSTDESKTVIPPEAGRSAKRQRKLYRTKDGSFAPVQLQDQEESPLPIS